jgi:hypothetical protein
MLKELKETMTTITNQTKNVNKEIKLFKKTVGAGGRNEQSLVCTYE